MSNNTCHEYPDHGIPYAVYDDYRDLDPYLQVALMSCHMAERLMCIIHNWGEEDLYSAFCYLEDVGEMMMIYDPDLVW